jgi:DNA-binding MarR family transcriptional regulator
VAEGAEGLHGTEEIAVAVRTSVTRVMRQLRLNRTEEIFTPFKMIILGRLYDGKPVVPTVLAARERIRPQSLTRVLAALEERGFVSRQMDGADRRRQLIRITEEGKEALIMDVRRREAWLSAAMRRRLSPQEREALLTASRLLDRLTEEEPAP